MDEPFTVNESILLNYFADSLSPSQRREVEEWIALSAENKKIARDVYHIYRASDTLGYMKQIDAVTAFGKVRCKIHRRPVSWIVWGQRVAALLILPLLVTTLYLSLKKTPMEYVELKTNPGMVACVDLPDGTKVWLNSGSTLKHPVKFTGDTRSVELNGEAYFSVHKDRSKRFIVNTPFHIQTEVLGTEFNIEAYQTDSVVKTTLISGSVKLLFLGTNGEEQTFMLKPDEEFAYHATSGEAKVSKPCVEAYTAWKDGMVVFRNTPLEEALKILSKRFNVEFMVKSRELYNSSFTGVFDGQHLPLILEHIQLASGIRYHFTELNTDQGKGIQKKTKIELF